MSALLVLLALVLAQGMPAPERPRDPWVFRSVLDDAPRRVILALDRDLWIAYDAETCALYKAWKGGVRFEGAVYTSVHGPQPRSFGTSYTEGIAGPAWSAERGGRAVPLRARYRGHALHGVRASLEYELVLADGATVTVEETPEFVRPEWLFDAEQRAEGDLADGLPGLARRFVLRGASDDLRIALELRTEGVESKLAPGLERERFIDVMDAHGVVTTQCRSSLVLTAAHPVNQVILFFAPLGDPADPNTPRADHAAPPAPSKDR